MATSQHSLLDMAGQEGRDVTTMNTTSVHDEGVVTTRFQKYISDEAFPYIMVSIMTVFNGVVATLGIVTNILNIIVFIKQGVFSDSSTISLFGLAVADFFSVASTLWIGIWFCVVIYQPPGLNWSPFEIMYMTAGWPKVAAGLMTRTITAVISLERCFCVVFPFKVKNVFTTRCSSITVFIIFAYFILSYVPPYVLNTFHFVTDPETNKTRYVLVEHPGWQFVQTIIGYGNIYTLNFLSVFIVLVCTMITVSRVKLSMAWRDSMGSRDEGKRETTAKGDKSNEETETGNKSVEAQPPKNKMSSSKMRNEKKLIRMITLISTLFLVCYVPSISLPVQYSYDREIRTDGLYSNLAWTMYGISWGSETINSSINVFIYYRMSTKFRTTFNAIFGISKGE